MTWNARYLPPDPNQWQGQVELPADSCFFQTIQMLNLLENKSVSKKQYNFALIGFRCDEGIRRHHGRPGATEGPAAIRQELAKLPIHNPRAACYDAGNIMCPDGDLEAAQQSFGEIISLLLKQRFIPIALGGGHEMAWGHFQGIESAFPREDLGIINFNAHFDMLPLLPNDKGSSRTPFLQIAQALKSAHRRLDYNCVGIQHTGNIRQLFDTAKMYNTHYILADELHMGLVEKCVDFIDRIIDENDVIYMSLCLSVFAAAYAPGVSSIQPVGLTPWDIIPFVRQLSASGKVASFDVAELLPRHDIDHRTAKLAASLVYEFIHHYGTQPRPW